MAESASFVPAGADLDTLRLAARSCHGCDLYREATQTAFGRVRPGRGWSSSASSPATCRTSAAKPWFGPAGAQLRRAVGDKSAILRADDREAAYEGFVLPRPAHRIAAAARLG
jgi:uracil-DNA glycosylase